MHSRVCGEVRVNPEIKNRQCVFNATNLDLGNEFSLARWMPRGFAEVAGSNWQSGSMPGPTFGFRTTHSTFHPTARCYVCRSCDICNFCWNKQRLCAVAGRCGIQHIRRSSCLRGGCLVGLPKSPVRTGKTTQCLVPLSAPVPPTRHSTPLRAARLD